jgi:hypothetical protein
MGVFAGLSNSENGINAQSAVIQNALSIMEEHLAAFGSIASKDSKLTSGEKNELAEAVNNIKSLMWKTYIFVT